MKSFSPGKPPSGTLQISHLYRSSQRGLNFVEQQDCSENILRLHAIGVSLHCLNTNLLFLREENIDLVYKEQPVRKPIKECIEVYTSTMHCTF